MSLPELLGGQSDSKAQSYQMKYGNPTGIILSRFSTDRYAGITSSDGALQAWIQSFTHGNPICRGLTNRTFIERCLERAIRELRKEGSVAVDPSLDRDTAGIPGSPILQKRSSTK